VSLLAGALVLILANTPEYTTLEKVPSLAAPAVAAAATFVLFCVRSSYANSIAFYTRAGIAVVAEGVARSWIAVHRTELEKALSETISSWKHLIVPGAGPGGPERIDRLLSRTSLIVRLQESLLEDRKHGLKAAGFYYPATIAVRLRPSVIHTSGEVEFFNLVRHEVAHACLSALGIPDHDQHRVMAGAVDSKGPWVNFS